MPLYNDINIFRYLHSSKFCSIEYDKNASHIIATDSLYKTNKLLDATEENLNKFLLHNYNEFFSDKIKIHCFEPHPVSYYFLKKNLSSFDNIRLYNFALGNENKEDYMSIPGYESHRLSNLGTMSIGQNSNNLKAKILIKKLIR